MAKRKSEPKDKHQQLNRNLIDLVGELKCLATRFEICGFIPSINQHAKQISHEALMLFGDISFKIWLGEDGVKYASRKILSQDDAYMRDLLLFVMNLTKEKYLRNVDPQQASIDMMRIANLIQKDFIKGKRAPEGSLPSDSESTADSLQDRKWEELDNLDHYLLGLYNQWEQKLEEDENARFPSLRKIKDMLKRHPEIKPELKLTQEGVRARLKKLAKEPWLPEYPYHRHAKRKTKETPYDPDHIENMLDKDEAHPLE